MSILRKGLFSRGGLRSSGRAPLSIVVVSIAACAASVFGCASYPARTEQAFRAFETGDLDAALRAYEDPETTGSAFLCGVEAGTVALASGEWDRAQGLLRRAAASVEEVERQALLSPASMGESLLGWALNDANREYRGEGYERVMVHAGLAVVYLAKGDLEAAQVEVRLANALLESEEKLYEKEYQAGGLGHFLSAITYELDEKPDEAYIDYKRMQAKGVGGELVGRALVRLARRLHFESDLQEWVELYGDHDPHDREQASVVVVAGVGVGPYKREIALTIPTTDGILQWAVPDYVARPQPVDGLELSVAGGDQVIRTVVIEDVAGVASENLADRIAWLAAKSAVRSVVKRELTQQLEEQQGIWGRIVGDVFAFVTERADLRAWQTLPDSWQAARVFLPAGIHEITLTARGGERCILGSFELVAGETMFVFGRTVGSRIHAHPVGGRRIEAAEEVRP